VPAVLDSLPDPDSLIALDPVEVGQRLASCSSDALQRRASTDFNALAAVPRPASKVGRGGMATITSPGWTNGLPTCVLLSPGNLLSTPAVARAALRRVPFRLKGFYKSGAARTEANAAELNQGEG